MSAAQPFTHDGAQALIHRDSASWKGLRTASLSGLTAPGPEAGAKLLQRAAHTLREASYRALIAPMAGDTWGAYRLVIESDGRAPFLMEPPQDDLFRAALELAGFRTIAGFMSAAVALPLKRPPTQHDFTLRSLNTAQAEDDLKLIHRLSARAFAAALLYRPIAVADFLAQYRPLLPLLDPDLVLFANNAAGETVGFLFGVPDFAQGPKPTQAILKTYASLTPGVGRALADAFHARAHAKGFTHVVHALMREDNVSLQHSAALGATVFRRYGLWGLEL